MKRILVAALMGSLLVSCSNSKKEDFDASIAVPDSLMPKATVSTGTPAAIQPLVPAGMPQPVTVGNGGTTILPVTTGQPQTITPPVINSMLTAPTTNGNAVVATSAGMNPPHGQPNHRCDIPVGAPLNSPKAATTTPQQNVVTSTPVTNPVKTAPGMNPPHGEPGHRCDIAVGAPLNSKPNVPATPAPVTVPATAPKADTNTGAKVSG